MRETLLLAAREAGRVLMEKFATGVAVAYKGAIDLVTEADHAAEQAVVAIRPEELQMAGTPTGLENEFAAEVLASTFLGELTVCDVRVNGRSLRFKTTQSTAPAQQVYIRLPAEKLKLFAR